MSKANPKPATKPSGKLDLAGLDSFSALLVPEPNAAGMREIPLEAITPDPEQPRKSFDSAKLAELADSIRAQGIIQPIVLRTAGDGFEIIAGERRWRAAKIAGLTSVPAIIRDDLTARAQMVENLQREDLSPFEIYRVIAAEIDGGTTQKQLAEAYGKGKSWVSEFASVSKMPTELQDALREGRAGDIYALAELNRLHKRAPEEVEKLASSGAPITRYLVQQLADKLARAVTGGQDAPAGDNGKSTSQGTLKTEPSTGAAVSGSGVADNGEGLDTGAGGPAALPGSTPSTGRAGDDYQPPQPLPDDMAVRIRVLFEGDQYSLRYTQQRSQDGVQQVLLATDNGLTLYAPLNQLELLAIEG